MYIRKVNRNPFFTVYDRNKKVDFKGRRFLNNTEKNNMLYLINKIVATYYKQYY